MTNEELKHIEAHLPEINVWIANHTRLQYSDTTKPIFEAYERETNHSINGCDDCKIDALIWARMEYNRSKEQNVKPKKTK